jgi:hypothetical protein
MVRVLAPERTRNELKKMMAGEGMVDRSSLVRQAARLIVEEALEAEAEDTLGRGYCERGAVGRGYRNGYRTAQVKSAEGAIEFAVPQVFDTAEPLRSRIREVIRGRTEELDSLFDRPSKASLPTAGSCSLRGKDQRTCDSERAGTRDRTSALVPNSSARMSASLECDRQQRGGLRPFAIRPNPAICGPHRSGGSRHSQPRGAGVHMLSQDQTGWSPMCSVARLTGLRRRCISGHPRGDDRGRPLQRD